MATASDFLQLRVYYINQYTDQCRKEASVLKPVAKATSDNAQSVCKTIGHFKHLPAGQEPERGNCLHTTKASESRRKSRALERKY